MLALVLRRLLRSAFVLARVAFIAFGLFTITGLQLGAIIAFAITTETVFQWPGMGLLFIQAVNFSDVPVMAAYLCFIALVFVTINLVVDLLYYAADPRLHVERVAH